MLQEQIETSRSPSTPLSVHISYDRSFGATIENVTLPFVAGVLADLSGQPDPPLPQLKNRQFFEVHREDLDAAVTACAPRLAFTVENRLEPAGSPIDVILHFRSMADFEPAAVATQIPGLLEALGDQRPEALRQLDEVLHATEFQRLEAAWRGLQYLLRSIDSPAGLKVRVLNVAKSELLDALRKVPDLESNDVFRKVYEPYGVFGADPFTVLIGDYAFSNHADDLEILEGMARIAASAHAPFLAAAGAGMFGVASFADLREASNLARILQHADYTRWRSFRDNAESFFAALVVPRMLLRAPYGGTDAYGIRYRESTGSLLWGSSAYALGARLAEAFGRYGWCAAIEGPEGGGLVSGLPTVSRVDSAGNPELEGPMEIPIDDVREKQLTENGFNCLLQWKGTNKAAFFAATTCKSPHRYDDEYPTEWMRMAIRLPYVLAVSRFAHYLKVMMRDWIGSYPTREDCERFLNNWITQYVLEDDEASPEMKARFPLRAARVELNEKPDAFGRHIASAFLRPHFQLADPVKPLRVVMVLPEPCPRNTGERG